MLKTKRQSNLELLRIISMLMIILHHFAVHGKFGYLTYNQDKIQVEKHLLYFQSLGKIGVAIFVIIGAYFLVGKTFKSSRIINLLVLDLFYSTVIYFVFIFLKLPFPDALKNENLFLTTVRVSSYWFVLSYMFILLAMPALNIVIHHFSKRQLEYTIAVLGLFWTILPKLSVHFLGELDFYTWALRPSDGIMFIFLYIIAAYIRLHPNKFSGSFLFNLIATIIGFIIMYLSIIIPIHCNPEKNFPLSQAMMDLHSPLVIFLAIVIFNTFKNINIGSNKFINYISSSTFAVYLIHDNSLVRPLLWNFFDDTKHTDDILIFGLKTAVLILVTCLLIDIVRRLLFGKLFDYISNRIGCKLDDIFKEKDSDKDICNA
ncbi:acyltransferase [Ligilactobacillus ruminis]|uniref:Acyltransferase 3 domain-containing protein n=1 Tax=Ligilactobacillus ruminis ATCC 25644 TaxID=525362 RepID=E7FS06_9LACO|nr:acyltransferase [Ligilactobacillus ruminis]EFZ34288.1 hypothetical protein HMPREF0542_11683 [Ligilactobacillus ruminis ATCC 25644]EGX98308.1 hypothetical protein ANHS_1121 [Ligilactobacillus ruminis ATCC 25644]UWP40267.1 acyltransferase [Ligilactobacillus ruminis]